VLDALEMEMPKAKEMVAVLESLRLDRRVLILLPERNEPLEKSARNLPQVKTLRASYLNVRDVLGYDHVLMPLGALQVIESMLG
jgi:large subunit ribosomal protein L4